jgi:hypothetical protein
MQRIQHPQDVTVAPLTSVARINTAESLLLPDSDVERCGEYGGAIAIGTFPDHPI